MLPKRRCWKEEQERKCGFSTHLSKISGPNWVLTPLKSASFEIRISSFVPPSQIFVWEGTVINFMLPKRRGCKAEQTVRNIFSKHVSTIRSPNRVLKSLKSASKRCSGLFVRPSQNLRLGVINVPNVQSRNFARYMGSDRMMRWVRRTRHHAIVILWVSRSPN
jgi:hypothetical protein